MSETSRASKLYTRKWHNATPEEREQAQSMANDGQYSVRGYAGLDVGKAVFFVRPRYRCIEDVIRRNERAGGKWFSPDNMRFFSSRVQSAIYTNKRGEAFFVTSERDRYRTGGQRRLYSVRVARLDGQIDTVGEFQGHATGRAAHAAARRAAEGGTKGVQS